MQAFHQTIYGHKSFANKISDAQLLRLLRTHHSTSKELADGPKAIPAALQLPGEEIVLLGRLDLAFANRLDRRILRCADGAFGVFVRPVEAALVEGVLAEEMDGGQVETSTAGLASTGLEYHGL